MKIFNHYFGIFNQYRFGFIKSHHYLTDADISELRELIYNPDNKIIYEYETSLGMFTDGGFVKTFASGRMAFYLLLNAFNVGKGDEVILIGFTCSVMINAVFRIGAFPIYSDIDINTFGSSPKEIEKKISKKTKVIVAQHSFGIPCEIKDICSLGKKYGIPVIEDCSISLDSLYQGQKIGTFGDAAFFSTDHSKPINTMIGGWLSIKDQKIFNKVLTSTENIETLSVQHQIRLLKQVLFEKKYANPILNIKSTIQGAKKTIHTKIQNSNVVTFLTDDFNLPNNGIQNYPYPSAMPAFLAKLGMFEVKRWLKEKLIRKKILSFYLDILKSHSYHNIIPKCYFNKDLEITPLRFVLSNLNVFDTKLIEEYFNTSWFWFNQPVIGSSNRLEELNYQFGSCPNAEKIGKSIVNFPCVIQDEFIELLLEKFKKLIIK